MGLAHDTTPTVDDVLSVWTQEHQKVWLSRKEIADCLARSKSPSLITIIGVAVGLGLLQTKTVKLPNGTHMFMYRPTPDVFLKLAQM